MSQLHSDLDTIATESAPAFVPTRQRLEWWEDAPRQTKEKRYDYPERMRRKRLYYAGKPLSVLTCCSVAWPEIDIALPVESELMAVNA